MQTTDLLKKLTNLGTETLRENSTAHLIQDLLICISDNVPLHNWVEDVTEDPDAYPDYTISDLETFLYALELN